MFGSDMFFHVFKWKSELRFVVLLLTKVAVGARNVSVMH